MKQSSMHAMLIYAFCFVLAGCAAQRALNQWKGILDPLVGQTKDSVLLVLGPPSDRISGDSIEVWKYYQEKGTSSTAITNFKTGQYYGSVSESRYDDINVYFRGGTMIKWTAKVQR